MVLGIQSETDRRTAINCLMNGIFKLPSTKTGLVSKSALELPQNKRTPEHFYGRTESAERLIKELLQNPNRSDKAIASFLKSRSRIHYVTKAENMALRSYNKKNPTVHWREAYRQCNVELVELVSLKTGRKSKYIYTIDGVVYNTLKDVASNYGISIEGARSRFFKSKKFPNWIAKEL